MAECPTESRLEGQEKSRATWGGSRSNSGRKRHHLKSFKERISRVTIFEEDRSKWKEMKKKSGQQSDAQFCRYLLDLAEKALLVS